MQHLRIHHLFNNPKKYNICVTIQKYRLSKFRTQKNTPLISVCKHAKFTPGVEGTLSSKFAGLFDLNMSSTTKKYLGPPISKSLGGVFRSFFVSPSCLVFVLFFRTVCNSVRRRHLYEL